MESQPLFLTWAVIWENWHGWLRVAAVCNCHVEGTQVTSSWQDAEIPLEAAGVSLCLKNMGPFIFFLMCFLNNQNRSECVKQFVPDSQGRRKAGSILRIAQECLHIIPQVGGPAHWLSDFNRNK